MGNRRISCHTSALFIKQRPHDGESGNTSRPALIGDKSIVGHFISEVGMEQKSGTWILESMSQLNKDINLVRSRITYLERRNRLLKQIVSWLAWIGIILIVMLGCVKMAKAEVTEASYYTYNSCIKEGTSGVWTASGERFNEKSMSCASWDYPFGTILVVKNVENGKTVRVVCNDRGPSKKLYRMGRKIDLSKAAMAELGGIRKGIIRVEIKEAI